MFMCVHTVTRTHYSGIKEGKMCPEFGGEQEVCDLTSPQLVNVGANLYFIKLFIRYTERGEGGGGGGGGGSSINTE